MSSVAASKNILQEPGLKAEAKNDMYSQGKEKNKWNKKEVRPFFNFL